MHLGDSIFILILALVLLGPKKTAELAQQLGKLMGEFRKASNDFKFQFNEEMRVSDQQEQKRKQEEERAALTAGATPEAAALTPGEENSILHGNGESAQVESTSEAVPYAISATTGDEHPVAEHPLLQVDVIPPMDGTPADPTVASIEAPVEDEDGPERGATESEGTSVHHG
jgi:sec-independent protein translocase protein TatB